MLAPRFDHLPAGVVNLLAGAGDVGEAIVRDERVDCVAFTGSVETGKRVAVACAERVARANLEMGGKDPFIVCSDVADEIAVAAKGGAWAAYLNAGQVCTSAERFYVMRDVYDDYVREFVDYTESLVLGDPLDPRTDIGPMVSARQREKVAAQVERAVAAGAQLVTGGDPTPGRSAATSSRPRSSPARPPRPTCCARRRSARWRRSSRCRASTRRSSLPTRPATGSAATSTRATCGTILRCMREIKAGTVWFNDPLTDNDAGPFGGMKQSGLGRELGEEGLEAFQETKHVHIETEIAAEGVVVPVRRRVGCGAAGKQLVRGDEARAGARASPLRARRCRPA